MDFIVIADKPPELKLTRLFFKPWSLKTEIADLAQFDIGVMPLPDDEWAKGKCGFKALQYMALSIPSLVSPVGVNVQIIEDGKNGFICSSESDWVNRLEFLINQPDERRKIGDQGRATVEKGYSVISNSSSFLLLFS